MTDEIKNTRNIINKYMYSFQIDSNTVPVFYINKQCWNDNYKRIIHYCLENRMCFLLVEPGDQTKRCLEITCECIADFVNFYDLIEKHINS